MEGFIISGCSVFKGLRDLICLCLSAGHNKFMLPKKNKK